MNRPTLGISSDYAVLGFNGGSFYYGYEHTVDDEWCFVAKFNGKEIVIPASKLGSGSFNVEENLLTGIGWVLAKYDLVEKERPR